MGYKIFPGQIDIHRELILSLWKEFILKYSPDRFDWLYRDNPSGPPSTYLAQQEASNAIVGSASVYPRRISLNGRTAVAGIAIDFMVSSSERVFGPAIKLQKTISENYRSDGYEFILGFPNRASHGIFNRIGYRELGVPKRYVKVLKTDVRLKSVIKNRFLARALGVVADSLWMGLCWVGMKTMSGGFTYRLLDQCDHKFDALWTKVRQEFPITGEKTAEYLNWRYTNNTSYEYYFFCIFADNGKELLGYIVYRVADGVAVVADMLFVRRRRVLACLLMGFSLEMRNRGVHSVVITYLGSNILRSGFRLAGFILRKTEPRAVFLKGEFSDTVQRDILDANRWYLFDEEVDL